LRDHVENVLREECGRRAARIEEQQTQSFRPGRPTPTHRYALAQ
jgi:hypothetical protein